jgi:rhodanese-related sulfurtransferase
MSVVSRTGNQALSAINRALPLSLNKPLKYVRFFSEYAREQQIPELTLDEVMARIGQPNFFVYDCNIEITWRHGHLPAATYLGFEQFPKEMLPSDRAATLVFYCYCHLCLSCNMAARRAKSFGYRNVWVMPKGTVGWRAAGFPMESVLS